MALALLNHRDLEVNPDDLQLAFTSPGYRAGQEVAILLATKARPDVINQRPFLLEWAFQLNNVELVQYLISAGAKVPECLIKAILLRENPEAEELKNLVRKAFMEPRSLADLAKIVIRRQIGKMADLDRLCGLPSSMRDFLTLRTL